MIRALWPSLALLVTLAVGCAPAQQPVDTHQPPVKAQYKTTSYHIYNTVPDPTQPGPVLRDRHGRVLTQPMSLRDWCVGADNGTLEATDLQGKRMLFNVDNLGADLQQTYTPGSIPEPTGETISCRKFFKPGVLEEDVLNNMPYRRFMVTTSSHGLGVGNLWLSPYRSVAEIGTPLVAGEVVFIPAFVGRSFTVADQPFIHDGYFLVADAGGPKDGGLDVFVGMDNELPGDLDGALLEVERVDWPEKRWELYQLHCPKAKNPPGTEQGWGQCP